MVMSWCTTNRKLPAFVKIPFKYNSPQNEDALNWDLYRLSLARMRFLQGQSTHWRATCSYPIKGIDFRDYLRGNFKDFNIFDFTGERQCKKVEYVNIRDTWARIWRRLSGRVLINGLCILTVPTPTVSLRRRGLVQCQVKTTLVGMEMASALNSDARKQPNPPPSIGLVLTANLYLLRDKTALQWVTELDQSPSDLIFKKHWFIDDFRVVFHGSIFNKIFYNH